MDQFICPTCMGGVVINRLCLFFSNNDNHEEEEAPRRPTLCRGPRGIPVLDRDEEEVPEGRTQCARS